MFYIEFSVLFTDIRELKKVLDIPSDDTQEDAALSLYIEQASSWLSELLNRNGMDYKTRTEYYRGTATQKLLLRSRPVYTQGLVVNVDQTGYYGSSSGAFADTTQYTYGVDYCLQIDQEDGTSRCGILLRINDVWWKPSARQRGLLSPFLVPDLGSIRVTYTAGYTVDNLPAIFRTACNLLVAKLRYLFPLGMELGSDGYEEKSIGMVAERKDYLLALVKPMLLPYFRNFTLGGAN